VYAWLLSILPPRFKRSKTVKVTKFPLFKNLKKKLLYFDIDLLRQLLDPSGPPQCAVSTFQNIPPHYVLQPAIQFHLLNTFSLHTCATAIPPLWKILKVSCSESKKIIPMPRPFTSFTVRTKIQLM